MNRSYADVVVVGSGLIGLAAAHELLGRGMEVAIVGPRTGVHNGQASRAAGAMLTVFSEVESVHPEARVRLEVGERLAARDAYDEWLAGINAASGQEVALTQGVWVIANGTGENDSDELTAIARAAKMHGHVAELQPATEVPGLAPKERAYNALWLPLEASVDPRHLVDALAAILHAHPQCRWVDSRAVRVREQADHLVVDAADGSSSLAAHLVLAAGAGTTADIVEPTLAERISLPPIVSGRGVSLLLRAPFALPSAVRTPNRGFACGSHLVPLSDGRVYLGATNRLSTEPDYEAGATLDEIETLIHDGAAELNSGLRQATLLAAMVGHRPVAFDHLPLVGTTQHPTVHIASATYRCGVLLAPRIAKIVADGIFGPGSHGDHPYRPTRTMEPPDLKELLDTASRGLVDLICQPGGRLPPGSDDLLARLLRVLLSEVSESRTARAAVMQRLWARAPMDECIPLLMAAVSRS